MKRALISAAVTAAAVSLTATPAFASTPHHRHHRRAHHRPHAVTVRPGESFWLIGRRFGVDMIDLANYNDMDYAAPLDAGLTLQLPPRGWTGPMARYTAPTKRVPPPSVAPSATPTPTAVTPAAAEPTAPSGIWACIAAHESGGNPATDTGNGYYGMYQFALGTWYANGGVGNPAAASTAEQTAVAQRVQATQGWGAWPVTSAECGV